MFVQSEGHVVTVEGQIAKVEDYELIKAELDRVVEEHDGKLEIVFGDSYTLTSAIIGYLIKLVRVNGVSLTITAKNHKLCGLLDSLALTDILNVRKG